MRQRYFTSVFPHQSELGHSMASSSSVGPSSDDDQQEDQLERFDDFTLASSWERFISEIEAICRQWLADGPRNLLEKGAVKLENSHNLTKVKYELKYATKSYNMEYYFDSSMGGKFAEWDCTLHDLQLCFGVKEFLVIAPQSASGVVLDAPEASKLLSAVAIALTNCCSLWPTFVPVHDPSRKAYIGIQNMGTVFTRRFEADRIGSQVPVRFMHLEGLYELFVSKFAYSMLDSAMHLFKVHFTMKSTYRTILHNDEDDIQITDAESKESGENSVAETHSRTQWDEDCPWSKWYSAEDPVKGFELVATWSKKIVESSTEMAELENASPHEAEKWTVLPILSPNLDSSDGRRVGFASQLVLLVDAWAMSFSAQYVDDFVAAYENPGSDSLKSSMVVPSPTVLDRVLKDLFQGGSQYPDFAKDEHNNSRFIKGAPLGSLFAQFCLHSLWIGNCNIRAIAVLWVEFLREIRWCWEESQPLPKMSARGSVDLSTCLINQKLQMLAICIEKKFELNEEFQDCIGTSDYTPAKEDGLVGDHTNKKRAPSQEFNGICDSPLMQDSLNKSEAKLSKSISSSVENVSTDRRSFSRMRRGSAGEVGSMMLLNSYQSMHAPYTQDPPLMTEDMHEERLQAVEASGGSINFSAQLERDILLSDMSAFKAANPDAVFEDFIRWHSPGDWEVDDTERRALSTSSMALKDNWPPRGRLSQRMSEHGNLWRKIWNETSALPASEQKPLLDPIREGEKVLHYLETLQPHQLLEQIICTAFKAAADMLNQTNFGGLKQMTVKMEQLYLTMASTLKPLQGNHISSDSETIEDLRRLCLVFEHVEKLLALAASLHRKFMQASRLSEAIFSDYYNFYLPKMGVGSLDADQRFLRLTPLYLKLAENAMNIEFRMQQQVRMHERNVVSRMFMPPSANQSWRKVLSMGNLLNGHEPIVREIIFSVRDNLSNSYHISSTPTRFQQETETYRMYICGTSNDLRVALSVTSCD